MSVASSVKQRKKLMTRSIQHIIEGGQSGAPKPSPYAIHQKNEVSSSPLKKTINLKGERGKK